MPDDSLARRRTIPPRDYLLRSLLPFAALLLLLSMPWIGPYGLLVATIAWWMILQRIR